MKKVITYGTFDLFHEGHYNLLKRAKELGDYLVVGVTTEYYDLQRGKLNVVNNLLERIGNVKATGFADEIIVEDHEGQKQEDILKYGIDIFVLGSDWVGSFDYLKNYCEVVYLERTPHISSTEIRKRKYPLYDIGVVGTGRIVPRFLSEAKYVSGVNVKSAYNPNKEHVEKFAEQYNLEAYHNNFDEFLEDIDAIYIASPHETHYRYAEMALKKRKHVLSEKPLTFTVEEAEKLYRMAEKYDAILMEGIKTAYCPGFVQMMNVAKSGIIGDIKDVEACFTRLANPKMRERTDKKYGGAFLEYGSYTLLPIFKIYGCSYESIEFNSIKDESGIDVYTKINIKYKNGLATSKTGVAVKSEGQLVIAGTKGYILAESPWWLTRSFEVRFEDPNKKEKYSPKFLGDGLRYEISDFISKINGTQKTSYYLTKEESIAMAGVVEEFMKKNGKGQ